MIADKLTRRISNYLFLYMKRNYWEFQFQQIIVFNFESNIITHRNKCRLK